jgi:hypothetical protein
MWYIVFGYSKKFNVSYEMYSKNLYFENVHERYVFNNIKEGIIKKDGIDLKLIDRFGDEIFLFGGDTIRIFEEENIIEFIVNENADNKNIVQFIKNNIKYFNKEFFDYINTYFKFKKEIFVENFI